MNELLNAAAASLRKADMNEQAKAYVLNDKVLFNLLKRAADLPQNVQGVMILLA
jgi:hypothetical protein